VAAARDQVGAIAGLVADLSDLPQVTRLADEASELRPTVLINNAGIYARERTQTASGEATWVVNHLAASLLADALIPTMTDGGRIVYVSSIAHGRAELDLDDPEFERKPYDHYAAYAQSKLANLLMARETARRLGPDSAVSVNALHPGVIGTKLLTEGFQVPGRDDLDAGSATSVFLALDADPTVTGGYWYRSKPAKPQGAGNDMDLAAALYDYTMQVIEERG
jgi:NAD(P)-dependent dehydrogenase (short-subunit alcohol dehydrogenase family)